MFNPKKKLPKVGEEVLLIVKTVNGLDIHEGMLLKDGRWYLYKYDVWHREVIGWKPKPQIDDFHCRFLAFALGYAIGIAFVYAVALFMGG